MYNSVFYTYLFSYKTILNEYQFIFNQFEFLQYSFSRRNLQYEHLNHQNEQKLRELHSAIQTIQLQKNWVDFVILILQNIINFKRKTQSRTSINWL